MKTVDEEKKELEREAEKLAKETEIKLRGLTWRSIVYAYTAERKASESALLLAGAILALLIPNLKDLLEIIDLIPLKIGLCLFLGSACCGLAAMNLHRAIIAETSDESVFGKALTQTVREYLEKFKSLEQKAAASNIKIGHSLDFEAFFKPLEEAFPGGKKKVVSELAEREKDPERKWRTVHQKAKMHLGWVSLQMTALVVGIVVMVFEFREPPDQMQGKSRAVEKAHSSEK